MCLIAFAWQAMPDHPLLMIANRDEFYARQAAPMDFWDDQPQILAGRDLSAGGTWLGVSRNGRLAAVTNVRVRQSPSASPKSRGELVTDFLQSEKSAKPFADALQAEAACYGPFNLLLWDGEQMHYAGNTPEFRSTAVTPGLHALSNAALDTDWPKARRAKTALSAWIASRLRDEAGTLEALNDRGLADDENLPQTGVGLDMERTLSSPFIVTPTYGTRCSSLIRVDSDRQIQVLEQRYEAGGQISGLSRFAFTAS
ncbi:MAG: NRDE family protein [Panacagrimonas sp.]